MKPSMFMKPSALALALPIALLGCGGPAPEPAAGRNVPPKSTTARFALGLDDIPTPQTGTILARELRRPPQIGPNVRVNGATPALARNEAAIAWIPTQPDRLLVSANDYRSPGPLRSAAGAYASFDGGKTFPVDGLVPGLTRSTGGTYDGAGNTSVACALDGTCYLAAMVYERPGPRSGIAVSKSSDGGKTWDAPRFVVADDNPRVLHDKPWVTVNTSAGPRRGEVYITWTRFLADEALEYLESPIYLSRSEDRGKTWAVPRQISPRPYHQAQGSRPLVDRAGRLHVVYENYPSDDPSANEHVIQTSIDGGKSFGTPVRISRVHELPLPIPPARYRTNSFPVAAADPVSGALLVAWSDYRSGAADLLLSISTDGLAWSAPVRVNDTRPGATVHHVLPALACGPQGACGASFYSSRNDPGAVKLDLYYASLELRNGGHGRLRAGAGRNVRVSTETIDPEAQLGGQYIGDYTGLAIGWNTAHPVWTDTRLTLVDDRGVSVPVQSVFTSAIRLGALRP